AIHLNFLFTTAGLYAVMVTGAVGRLLTIPYEMRIMPYREVIEFPIPFLAILRQASYSHATFILWIWTIERACATIFVSDYEQKSRFYISYILNGVFIPGSYLTAYLIVTGELFCLFFLRIGLCLISGALQSFRLLIVYNVRRLARLTHHVKRHPDEYSLSLRVQLNENVRSMKKIEFGVYLLSCGLAGGLLLIFTAVNSLSSPYQFEKLQWTSCVGNLIFAFFILCSAPWLQVAIAIHTGDIPPILRFFLCKR
ncbi:hypothetical protein PENTCL1PPCAC_14611, partial [Pristionchus entomophagus]